MTGLMIIFLLIGAVGFLFLLASFLIGDIFDALGMDFGLDASHDFGVFDSRVVGIFLTAFGGVGLIGAILGFGAVASTLFAVLGGVALGAVVFYFGRMLYNQQSNSSVSAGDLVGRRAQVVVAIHPGKVGQISCLVGEERIEKLARAADGSELKAGETVFIEQITGDAVLVSRHSDERLSLFSEKS